MPQHELRVFLGCNSWCGWSSSEEYKGGIRGCQNTAPYSSHFSKSLHIKILFNFGLFSNVVVII